MYIVDINAPTWSEWTNMCCERVIAFLHLFIGCICCRTRKDELDGEVFDVLFTFSDFTAFKEMFLDYKAVSNYACYWKIACSY
jgi:hypothetical protein